MTRLNPYLFFNGNCEDAFNFYKSVFGKDFIYIGRYKDVPQTGKQFFFPKLTKKLCMFLCPLAQKQF